MSRSLSEQGLQRIMNNSMETDVDGIDLKQYNPSCLTPTSEAVYIQWQTDTNDELLIDGYFRECNIITHTLPTDIAIIIISYYTKSLTKEVLKSKIQEIQRQRRIQYYQRNKMLHKIFKAFFIIIASLSLLNGVDIAALIIINKYDCDLLLNTDNKWFGVNNFLFVGSIAHISITLLPAIVIAILVKYRHRLKLIGITCLILVSLFFISYSIMGIILYSATVRYHQCSNILISWVIFKLVIYLFFVPFALNHIPYHLDLDTCGDVYTRGVRLIAIIGILFGADIAGLIVTTNNDCDLSINGGSKWVMFGVNSFLLCGCSIHMAMVIIETCVRVFLLFQPNDRFGEEKTVAGVMVSNAICDHLFIISWCVIGCLLYSEMNQNTVSNKRCADVTISWIVLRFLEYISVQPFVIWSWYVWFTYDDS